MVSVGIPQLAFKLSDQILSNFETLIAICQQISTVSWSDCHVSIVSFILYLPGTFLAVTAPAWILLLYTKKKMNKIDKDLVIEPISFEDEVNVEPPPDGMILDLIEQDAFPEENTYEIIAVDDEYTDYYFTDSDAEYAEQIQLQDTMLASILTSSSSVHQPISHNSSQSFCQICLENKQSPEMFTNDKCSHTFCYDCTTSHIMAKIEDKAKSITCPALNCKSTLNYNDFKQTIPKDALVKWDEILCLSLIPESHKLYCPFRDCSSMLVNDSNEILKNIMCLACKRSFCADCRVPWHTDFSCDEFQKLNSKEGSKDDKIVKMLAKKKNWQKCPKCKMYVEKTEGCIHITCRCKYQFCYRCGSKWSDNHGNCRPKLNSKICSSKCKWVDWISSRINRCV